VRVVGVELAVKPLEGETLSQLRLPQLCSSTCIVVAASKGAVTVSVCVAGAFPPAIALKVKLDGLSVNTADGAANVTLREIGTVCVPNCESIVIVPTHVIPGLIPA
jgi:hypothetical protein